MKVAPLRTRHDRDRRQVKGLGDRSESAGAVIIGLLKRLARTVVRPLDDREIGVLSASDENGPADVGRHQPGVEVAAGEAGNLADDPGARRASLRTEVLHPAAP